MTVGANGAVAGAFGSFGFDGMIATVAIMWMSSVGVPAPGLTGGRPPAAPGRTPGECAGVAIAGCCRMGGLGGSGRGTTGAGDRGVARAVPGPESIAYFAAVSASGIPSAASSRRRGS